MRFFWGNIKPLLIAFLLILLATGLLSLIKPKGIISDEAGNWEKNNNVLGATTANNCPGITFLDILVDKNFSIPTDYMPPDLVEIEGHKLRSETANELKVMLYDARASGFNFKVYSGYRSFEEQNKLYQSLGNRAAPPGHSEHQLGTAMDLTYSGKTWNWLDQNAHKYGFVMSYRGTQQNQTGYQFEPWHWRYVGVDLANKIRYSTNSPQSFYRKISC